jgi:hypothetical protein
MGVSFQRGEIAQQSAGRGALVNRPNAAAATPALVISPQIG